MSDKKLTSYKNFTEYCEKLTEWLNQQQSQMFSQYMSSQMQFMIKQNIESLNNHKDKIKPPITSNNNSNNNFNQNNSRVGVSNTGDNNENDSEDMPIQGQRYSLPHPVKRMVAEFIDYLLLMMMKIGLIFLIHGKLSISEIAETIDFDFRYLLNKHKLATGSPDSTQSPYSGGQSAFGADANEGGALSRSTGLNPFEIITLEIVYAEIINRILITLYEAVWLSGIIYQVSATPGKLLMGLRVVSCKDLFDLPMNRVEVLPGSVPGFAASLVRSLIKNFAMVFFLPLCMTALIFSHHRTSYDLISGTIVVKVPPPRQQRLNMAGLAARNPNIAGQQQNYVPVVHQ